MKLVPLANFDLMVDPKKYLAFLDVATAHGVVVEKTGDSVVLNIQDSTKLFGLYSNIQPFLINADPDQRGPFDKQSYRPLLERELSTH